MIYAIYFVHVIVSLFLILVVLLQQGKGADLSVFGGGSTQAAFGARGAATILHKLTVICFVLFIVTTLSIGLFQTRGGGSVLEGIGPEDGPAAEELSAPAGGELPAETTSPATPPSGAPESATPVPDGAAQNPAEKTGEATSTEGSGNP